MYNRRFTPEKITKLASNEIFVFGSNLAGSHGGGAARAAYVHFGAIWGLGVGMQGQSYAIPTMQGGVDTIKPYVDQFIAFAKAHREYTFLVTRIGRGIAGFTADDMAPLFAAAIDVENILLPEDFVMVLQPNRSVSVGAQQPSWDPQRDFLAEYAPLMKRMANADKEEQIDVYSKIKALRVKEFYNTVKLVCDGSYIAPDGTKVTFEKESDMVAGTRFYSAPFSVTAVPQVVSHTRVEVVNADCIAEGLRLADLGYNPAVLNMASRQNPGGAVASGAGAQEETIFRRSNLFRSLYQFASFAHKYGVKALPQRYPLDRNYGGVYSPYVSIFREDEKSGYKLMQQPRHLAFISVAGMNSPEVDARTGMIVDRLVEPIKHKIRTIYRIGLQQGHDSLVLGALGCGAYRNPPAHIARLFREVLAEEEFANKYKLIVFAILEDHNSYQMYNAEGNYLPFKREFSL